MIKSEEWIRRNHRTIQEFLSPRTAPLLIFDSGACRDPVSRGSGVLVELGGRHFILTAGHCVAAGVAAGRMVCLPISTLNIADGSRLVPKPLFVKIVKSNYVSKDEGTVDFGYFELDPDSAGTMKAKFYIFTGIGRIIVRGRSATQGDEWVLVIGYPGDEARVTVRAYQARAMLAFTLVAAEDELPEVHGRDDFSSLDLLLPPECIVSPMPGELEQAEPSSFGGVSGGGCWLVDISLDPEHWTIDNKPSLCAIHAGTGIEKGRDFFLREVPIAYHLRMLADDYPDLAPKIHACWPEIANVATADSFR